MLRQLLRRGYDVDSTTSQSYTDLRGTRLCEKICGSQLSVARTVRMEKRYAKIMGRRQDYWRCRMACFTIRSWLNCGTQIHRDFEIFNANFGWTPVTIRSVFTSGAVSR